MRFCNIFERFCLLFNLKKDFIESAKNGDAEAVQKMIFQKINLDKTDDFGNTALLQASCFGHFEIVKILINEKSEINHVNRFGTSALLKATSRGHFEVLKFLIKNNAKINHQNISGFTALMIASVETVVFPEMSKILDFLILSKSDVNILCNDGESALQKSILFNHFDVAEKLVFAGADTSLVLGKLKVNSQIDILKNIIKKYEEHLLKISKSFLIFSDFGKMLPTLDNHFPLEIIYFEINDLISNINIW